MPVNGSNYSPAGHSTPARAMAHRCTDVMGTAGMYRDGVPKVARWVPVIGWSRTVIGQGQGQLKTGPV